VNFPRGKPIYTDPRDMTPAGQLQFTERSSLKEGLVEELRETTLGSGISPALARAAGGAGPWTVLKSGCLLLVTAALAAMVLGLILGR